MTKEANPTFGLYIESRTGSLIIMSVLHSAQGEASISCHTVGAHRVIFSKALPLVRADLFITSLWDSTPTHCCTWMYLGGSVITTGVTGLGLMTDNKMWNRGEEHVKFWASAKHMHRRNTHTHRGQMRLYQDSVFMARWQMKTDSVCVFYIMFNGFTFSRHRMVVHQGNVSYTLSGAVYLVREGKVV